MLLFISLPTSVTNTKCSRCTLLQHILEFLESLRYSFPGPRCSARHLTSTNIISFLKTKQTIFDNFIQVYNDICSYLPLISPLYCFHVIPLPLHPDPHNTPSPISSVYMRMRVEPSTGAWTPSKQIVSSSLRSRGWGLERAFLIIRLHENFYRANWQAVVLLY